MRVTLSDMQAFQAVADVGGFSAAAAELRVSQSVISRAVARLERRLGTTLLHRSTRHVSLTEEGVIFLAGCRRVLEDVGEIERSVTASGALAGTLRISASVLFGQDSIVPLLPAFMERHPGIQVRLSLSDRHVDLIEDHIDVAVRLGRLPSSSLIAKRLGEHRRVIVASPSYLARHGWPRRPDDLAGHDCLLWDEEHDDLNRWPFQVGTAVRHIKMRGRLSVNNAQALLQLAVHGAGITRMGAGHAAPLIRSGELVSLLEAYHRDEAAPVHALYTRTNIAKPRVRAFLNFLTEALSSQEAEPGPAATARTRRRR
jgi:DNA-binding transcriptional LysR family regulator